MLSIVLVNSDNTDLTMNCLMSIYQNIPAMPFEVILVDNHSTQPCLQVVNESFPQVRTFCSPQRQGFAKNFNFGMRQAIGEFIMILNNDTIIHPKAFDLLLGAINDNGYGMVGPKLLSADGRIQTDCVRSFPTPWFYVRRTLWLDPGFPSGKWWEARIRQRLERQLSGKVDAISGSCMLVSRAVFERVGLLDEGYDFYYEDIEWCHRFRKNGFSVAYVAEARVTHLHDQSLSKVKEWAKQSEYRSALRYFRQYHHLSPLGAWGLWLVTVVGFFCRAFLFSLAEIFSKEASHAQAYRNLSRWIIRHPPGKENSS